MKISKAAAVAMLLGAAQSQAYFIDTDASDLGGNEVIDFSSFDSISLDANFSSNAPVLLSIQREQEDVETLVSLSAVVSNFTGFGWSSFSVRLTDGATLNQLGDVFAFTAVDYVPSAVDAGAAVTAFEIDEAAGFELGNVFGDIGISPWLVDVSAIAGGDSFGVEFSPSAAVAAVPAPATAWLLGSAILGFGALRRR